MGETTKNIKVAKNKEILTQIIKEAYEVHTAD